MIIIHSIAPPRYGKSASTPSSIHHSERQSGNPSNFRKLNHPKAKIIILEKGMLPQGASTKNAGFACFGSISEILSDLNQHTETEVVELVQKRWDGIRLLRNTLGDANIDFQQNGGHELFLNNNRNLFQNCKEQLDTINELITPVFGSKPFVVTENHFKFKAIF